MRQCRTILDDEHSLATDRLTVLHEQRTRTLDHQGIGIQLGRDPPRQLDPFERGGVHLVDQDRVGHANVGLAGVIAYRVIRPVGIHDRDQYIGHVEGEVVVAPVPDHHVRFLLGLAEDRLVVYAGVDDPVGVDVRLVLLALLDRHFVLRQVVVGLEALHRLLRQVSVGHRMSDDHDLPAGSREQLGHPSTGLALSGSGACGAHGYDGLRGFHHRLSGAEQHVGGSGGHRTGAEMHHVLVRDIAVGEHDYVHAVLCDQRFHLALGVDRDAIRVALSRENGRITPPLDVRDLRRREGYDLVVLIAAKEGVEVVKVTSGRAKNENALGHQTSVQSGSAG